MSIVNNIEQIIKKVHSINEKVELVGATKTRNIDEIKEAFNTGKMVSCGENRVQELLEKYDSELTWDFIGQLQTNKVKYIIDKVRLIHSVDRLNLAQTIDKEAKKINKVQDILIEINSGKEQSKGGIFLENLDGFLEEISIYDNIKVRGLMAVAPLYFGEKELRETFEKVYSKFLHLATDDMPYLSMGMSNDYLIAVESGANMIRVGRGIFGDRSLNFGSENH